MAQQWTVFELPATLEEVPAKIEQQFGCTWQELTEKYNISHLRITGQDFSNSWFYEGRYALHALAEKAHEVDLSAVTANPEWGFHSKYYEGPDPNNVIEYMDLRTDSLRRIVYPKTLHSIWSPLSSCRNLREVVWPDSLCELPSDMFRGCENLEQIDIPAGVRELPRDCFAYCYKLQSVTLHDGLQIIGETCFYNCTSLSAISLPATVTNIENNGFNNCRSLTSISLQLGLKEIGQQAFFGCDQLTSIHIPQSVTVLGGGAFYSCESLSSVNISDSITEIADYTFYQCKALTGIALPKGITSIGGYSFGYSGITEFDMPDAVTALGESAFSNCANLTRVHISRNLTSIPAYAFIGCLVLKEVNIPQRVTRIEHHAFRDCTELLSPTLPDGLTFLGYDAFNGCKFDHITLPPSLQVIQEYCFCYVPLRSIDIPASVIEIGSGAFYQCDSLRHVTLHEGLQYLQEGAFSNCPQLEDAQLPSSLRLMGPYVFHNNKRMKSFTLPPLISEVPDNVCNSCDSLATVTLHSGVTTIGNTAFYNCNSLTHIDLPEGVKTIGSWAFCECPLKEVNIPSTVVEIGDRAFIGGDYERVVVPEGVEIIGERAFLSNKLRYVDFPSTVSRMGDWALQGDGPACDSLVLRSIVPVNISGSVSRSQYGPIYVPAQSVQAYQQHPKFQDLDIRPLTGYSPDMMVIATTLTTDSVWFPVVNNVSMNITHSNWNENFYSGHLHVGKNVNWPLNHLRYDYQQAWQSYDWENQQPTGTLINEGTMTAQSMEMNLKYEVNQWFFFTPPFDMKVSDLRCNNPRTPFVLRTFDGAQRAVGNHDHVWTDVESTDTLKTGRGYILRYGAYGQLTDFYYEDRENRWKSVYDGVEFNMRSCTPLRTLALSSDDVTIPLTEYKGEYPHNEGWNFVANPFMAYFDIQQLESDAPILAPNRWDFSTFTAYSPLDDDFVLKPLQGFLVQRSKNQTEVVFHAEGRQPDFPVHHEAVNSARNLRRQALRQQRIRFDAELLQQTEQGDTLLARTRLVVTPRATEGYDRGQDAPFISMDDSLTALYTRSAGLRYSLNEQPPTARSVQLGVRLAQAGTYCFRFTVGGSFPEYTVTPVLVDKATGQHIDIADQQEYTFTASEPCTLNNRFEILLGDGITEIDDLQTDNSQKTDHTVYDLQGRQINAPSRGLYIRNGKKYTHY